MAEDDLDGGDPFGDDGPHLHDVVEALLARELGAVGGHAGVLAHHVAFDDELDDLAHGIDVGALVGFLPFDDFRGDELVFFDEELTVGLVFHFGLADVDDLDAEVIGGDEDILGFEVAVDDASLVHVVEAVAEVDENVFDLFLVEGAHADMFGERLSLDELKDDAFAQSRDILEAEGLADELVL